MPDIPATASERRTARRPLALTWWPLVGAGAVVVGLLPWVVTGMRLPLQNLWASDDIANMPVVLLPFSQYALTLIIAVLVVGAAAAGLVSRALRPRRPAWGFTVALGTVVLLQALALVQTALVVEAGLQERSESGFYLTALVAVAVLAILVGAGSAELIAAAPKGGAVIGLAVGACAVAPWLSGLLAPFGSFPPDGMLGILASLRWVPPILTGAAIAWAGVGTVGRVLGGLVGLGLVWIVPAITTGMSSAAGSRVLAHDVRGMWDYGVQVTVMAATQPGLALVPVLVAIVVAAVGLVARYAIRRTRPTRTVAADEPTS